MSARVRDSLASIRWAITLLLLVAQPAVAQLANSNWPMFHANLKHTGQSAVNGPQTAQVKWIFGTPDIVKGSPSIGADGTIYIAHGYALCAIKPDGTDNEWCYHLSGESTFSAPAVAADGMIYYGARDNRLYAFHPDGSLRCRYTIHNDGDVRTSPALSPDGGTIYFSGTWAGIVHAMKPDCTIKWTYKVGQGILWSSPAVHPINGTIYIGSTDGALHAFDPNGNHLWRLKLQGLNRSSSPVIAADNSILMGTTAGITSVTSAGAFRWFFDTVGYVEATPAIGNDGSIYVGTTTGKTFYALKEVAGKPHVLWTITGTAAFPTSPAIGADGVVYVSMGDTVLALRPNGTELWRYQTGNYINSSPAIADDGTLYIGSSDHNVYAFGP
jgi:outer membrane protein assembly factor BamB